jgi:hypothetical protein
MDIFIRLFDQENAYDEHEGIFIRFIYTTPDTHNFRKRSIH